MKEEKRKVGQPRKPESEKKVPVTVYIKQKWVSILGIETCRIISFSAIEDEIIENEK
jgi:hypothetical protein